MLSGGVDNCSREGEEISLDELSGVANTQAQKWLCSGRTSLARDFRSVSLALIGRETEPNNDRYVGHCMSLGLWEILYTAG
jgi:hypothetical protein